MLKATPSAPCLLLLFVLSTVLCLEHAKSCSASYSHGAALGVTVFVSLWHVLYAWRRLSTAEFWAYAGSRFVRPHQQLPQKTVVSFHAACCAAARPPPDVISHQAVLPLLNDLPPPRYHITHPRRHRRPSPSFSPSSMALASPRATLTARHSPCSLFISTTTS